MTCWRWMGAALLLTGAWAVPEVRPGSCELIVHLTGMRSDKGSAAAGIFQGPTGFPRQEQSLQTVKSRVVDGSATLVFPHLAAGTYAVAAMHDENNNGKFDRGFMGKPKEGFGFSNNPRVKMHLPPYASTTLKVDQPRQEIEIHMRY